MSKPNPAHIIKRVRPLNLDTIYLNKRITQSDSHNPFNKQVVLGQLNPLCIISLIN
jgi:hypothetical protein